MFTSHDAAAPTALIDAGEASDAADAADAEAAAGPKTQVHLAVPAIYTGTAPPLLALKPVRQEPLRGVPTHYDPSGKLVARCWGGDCEVYERASGAHRGTVPQARLASYRTAATSMSAASPDGALRLVRSADGALVLQRVAGDTVVARAQRSDAQCADVGAWHPTGSKVAVPCGQRVVVLAADGSAPRWSEPLAGDDHLVPEGMWFEDEPVILARKSGAPDHTTGPDLEAAAVFWDMAKGAELFSPGVDRVVTIDPVRSCVFDAGESCGCSRCFFNVQVRACEDSSALASHVPESQGPPDRVFSRSGLGLVTSTIESVDHESSTYRLDVARLVAGSSSAWSTALTNSFFDVVDDGRRVVAIGRHDDALTILERGTTKSIALGSDKILTPEDRKLLISDDEALVLVVAQRGAVAVDLAKAAVAFRWKDVTEVMPSPRGALVAGSTPHVEVRRANGTVAWSAPKDVPSRLVGWLDTGARTPALAVEIDGTLQSVTFESGKGVLGAAKVDLLLATSKPAALTSKYRLAGRRGIVRTADDARMNVGEDHVFPQAATDGAEWADVTSEDLFLLGDDVLASEILSFERVDHLFTRKGSFDAFLRGESLAPLPSASVSALPRMKRDTDPSGTVVLSTADAPAKYLEIEKAGQVTQIVLEASPRIERFTLERGDVIRARACSLVGGVCSEWESVSGPTQ